MEERYLAAKQILEKYHQEHLLRCYETLDTNEKEQLLNDILTIDFKQLEELYENRNKEVAFGESKIEPIPYTDKTALSEEEKAKYVEVGEEVIKSGKLAVVTMAGGQGTRLGHNGPKGTFDLGLASHKSIFEIHCETLKRASDKYKVIIPWYIMTSDENNEATVAFFEEHQYFGYPKSAFTFFKQGRLPMLDENGKILLTEQGTIKQAADGHGGIFEAIRKNGVSYDMRARNIEWIFISGVDNVLVKMVDPLFIGITVSKNAKAAGTSVAKARPEEKVGIYCKRDGKTSLVEYTEISKEMSEMRNEKGELIFAEANTLCNLFHIDVIEEISKNKLPYHSAHKKATYMNTEGEIIKGETPNAYKFESFMFDAFETLDNMVILRVKREEEFAPVKNAQGVDSPETARELYKNFYHITE